MTNPPEPIVELRGIAKHFGGVQALRGVDFRLFPGEVHALVGENGAGKSTLIKVLTGVHPRDGGMVRLDLGPGEVNRGETRDQQRGKLPGFAARALSEAQDAPSHHSRPPSRCDA